MGIRCSPHASTDAKETAHEHAAWGRDYFRFYLFPCTQQRMALPHSPEIDLATCVQEFSFNFRTCGRTSVRSRAGPAPGISFQGCSSHAESDKSCKRRFFRIMKA